jgi:hypothetical protein
MYGNVYIAYSASARISKGQGYQGFSRKRAGSSFGQKRAICIVQGKTDRISLLFGSIKCFPFSYNTRHFRLLPDGAGIINYQFKTFKKRKRAGRPWKVKGHKGAPWWQMGTAPF